MARVKVTDRKTAPSAAELLRPSPEFAAFLEAGYERVRRNPEAARRFYELVNSLPGKSKAEQKAIVEEALRVFPDESDPPIAAS